MQKFALFMCAAALIALAACSELPLADPNGANDDMSVSVSHAVSREQALDCLAGVLATIDGPGTRAGEKPRTVQRITTVSRADLGLPATRSGEPQDRQLVHLVEFEEGRGSAILAADDRLEPVIVVYDNKVVTLGDMNKQKFDPEAWRTPENLYCEEDDDYYLGASDLPKLPIENTQLEWQLIYDYIHEEAEDTGGAVYTKERGWKLTDFVRPMLTTQWHQNAPFSLRSLNAIFSGEYPAGCVTIAVAQIMNYHQFPRNYCNWSLISRYNPVEAQNSNNLDVWNEATLLSRKVADGCHVKLDYWGSGGTFSTPAKAKRFLRKIGYTGTEKHLGYDAGVIKKALRNDCPVFIGALSSNSYGHAWVIDGYLNYENIIKTYCGPSTVLETKTVNTLFVHCNWGWRPAADESKNKNGYYVSEIFNTRNGPTNLDDYENPKTRGTNSGYYTKWFRIVTYNKPK